MDEFIVGERIIIEVKFRDRGTATDPLLVQCYARRPAGQLETFVYGAGQDVITRIGEGHYEAAVIVDEAGLWAFRWNGSGALDAASEKQITVRASAVLAAGS